MLIFDCFELGVNVVLLSRRLSLDLFSGLCGSSCTGRLRGDRYRRERACGVVLAQCNLCLVGVAVGIELGLRIHSGAEGSQSGTFGRL